MDIEYIIVQAGGMGTRMEYLTANKPKALVPVGNRPMLFHLFEQFPDKKFVIIADYKSEVMKKYLAAFAQVSYLVVETGGKKGTCSGISAALEKVPSGRSFMLIWSDLVLPKEFCFPEKEADYVGLSRNFRCRWRYFEDKFEEIPSEDCGVAGVFLFRDKRVLENVPYEGEFVKWLRENEIVFETFGLSRTKEYGLIREWQKENCAEVGIERRCRPFNQMTVQGDVIVKEGIDKQGKELAVREKNWYRFVEKFEYSRIPKIYSYEPLTMQRIQGKNVFEYELSFNEKRTVIKKIVAALRELHSFGSMETDYFSIYDAYVTKTFKRLDKIRDLIPFSSERYIIVNGRKCRNVYFFKDELSELFSRYRCGRFVFIHGDNTFSNMLLDKNLDPVLIDPRGYFGHTELYGDPAYDWAKLYYSVCGNYDQFNLKRFRLTISESEVKLQIVSNGWEEVVPYFCNLIKDEIDEKTLKLLHAVIWLSLTTYAWEDYDSICGAFYNGIYYLEEVMEGGIL